MDRQLTIEPRGENFYLLFHNYSGPFEGHQITQELGVEEISAPADGSPDILEPGQGFLFQAMEYHPDLHALVSPSRLEALVLVIDKHNVHVRDGAEFLPDIEVEHDDENYIEYIEKLHTPVWEKGPKAIAASFLLRAIPAAIVIMVLMVASRHYGDHYDEVSVDELFTRLEQPFVRQSTIANLINPDHSHLARLKVHSIRFMEENRFIMADGNYLAVEGLGNIQPVFELAGMRNSPPAFDLNLQDGKAAVEELRLGDDVQARNLILRKLATLGASDAMPPRGGNGDEARFQDLESLPYDDMVTLENVLDQKLCLTGRLRMEGEDRVLRMYNGAGLVLNSSRAGAGMQKFLEAFTDDKTEAKVDVMLRSVYDWKDREFPGHSRESTKLIGEGTLYSISVQNYHIVAQR